MMMTILALATVLVSLALMFGGLRMVAQDTVQALMVAAQRARAGGQLPAHAAFVMLWVMIFVLSYL